MIHFLNKVKEWQNKKDSKVLIIKNLDFYYSELSDLMFRRRPTKYVEDKQSHSRIERLIEKTQNRTFELKTKTSTRTRYRPSRGMNKKIFMWISTNKFQL